MLHHRSNSLMVRAQNGQASMYSRSRIDQYLSAMHARI